MMALARLLLRGDAEETARWLAEFNAGSAARCVLVILIGCGLYGATIGIWRAPLQALSTAAKFPLLIFLTCAGNALLNGMLAQLLGSRLSFRETSLAILMSFATAALILGALSPATWFAIWNAPALGSSRATAGHSMTLLLHVSLIAYAGVIGNRRLFGLLERMSGDRATARRVLMSWLAGNLLLGAQLAWVLRPFIGTPQIAVQFLRDDPLRGNFYEAVARAVGNLF
ncbi:MAG: hypothetical protein ACR2ID_00510 [Chthoniobacterales bacterium]